MIMSEKLTYTKAFEGTASKLFRKIETTVEISVDEAFAKS
jgi:hypothetical protein